MLFDYDRSVKNKFRPFSDLLFLKSLIKAILDKK